MSLRRHIVVKADWVPELEIAVSSVRDLRSSTPPSVNDVLPHVDATCAKWTPRL